ncbi:MAG: hypothetical protein HOQ36_04980 [Nocardia sp.]|nr:hypothetical protein [Nocardia sp.]
MGVDLCAGSDELCQRIAERADRNYREERADAQQGERDGTLLYRADTEPEWVATWTDDDRLQVCGPTLLSGYLALRSRTCPQPPDSE